MPSRKSDTRPEAPSRLVANLAHTGDRFKTLIFHIAAPDYFLTINTKIQPEPFIDFVVIEPPINGEIKLEIFDRQEDYIGVVEWLDFYQLPESEQWTPRIPGYLFCLPFFLIIGRAVAAVII